MTRPDILTALGEALGCGPAETPEATGATRRRPHFPQALYHPKGKPIRTRRTTRRVRWIEVKPLSEQERSYMQERWEEALERYQGRWRRAERARSRARKARRLGGAK